MAEARKCDRCGKFYEIRKNGKYIAWIRTIKYDNTVKSIHDLCPTCSDYLLDWLNNTITSGESNE